MCSIRLSLSVSLACILIIKLLTNAIPPEITFRSTTYKGKYLTTWKGNQFAGFLGIPYAATPVGQLRFRDPEPLATLGPSYDATSDRNDCPSIYATNASEDCLHLNVYTKDFSATTKNPVIVFIHPGGLYIGSGLSSFIGAEYLLEKDIVLVTFNYRLGSLGYLNLGTKSIPGNAGFKDQVFALRWVSNHIANFGGDPKDITLMGYSSGGMSVSLHLSSPMSEGLFHKAIIMSGTLPPQLGSLGSEQIPLAQKQSKMLGCERFGNETEIVNCLNKFSGNEISATLRQMFDFGKDNPVYLWLPVLENDYGQERFLTEHPYKSFENGQFQKVPILIGFTSSEFCTSAKEILLNENLLSDFNKNFNEIAPKCYMYKKDDKITIAIKQHYFQTDQITKSNFVQLCQLFSDSLIRFGAQRVADFASKHTEMYRYKFMYTGRFSNMYYPGENVVYGPEHGDDLMYIFKTIPQTVDPTDPEADIIDFMTDLIFKFSKDGQHFNPDAFKDTKIIDISKYTFNQTLFNDASFWNGIFP